MIFLIQLVFSHVARRNWMEWLQHHVSGPLRGPCLFVFPSSGRTDLRPVRPEVNSSQGRRPCWGLRPRTTGSYLLSTIKLIGIRNNYHTTCLVAATPRRGPTSCNVYTNGLFRTLMILFYSREKQLRGTKKWPPIDYSISGHRLEVASGFEPLCPVLQTDD